MWTLSGVVIDAGTSALYFGTFAETAVEENYAITELSAALNRVLMSVIELLSPSVFVLKALPAGNTADAPDQRRRVSAVRCNWLLAG